EPQDDDVFFEELKIIGPGLDYYYDSTADPVAQEALQEAFLRDVGGELDLVDFDEAPEGPVEGTEWEDRGAIFMPLAAGSTLRVHPADAGQAPHSAPHDLATINQANDSSIQIDLDPPAAAFGIWLIDSELTSADEGILFFDDAGNQIGSLPMPATGYITSGPEANFFVGATSPGATRIARVQILESSNESPSEGVPLDDLRFSGALGACCLPQGACQVATRTTCAVDLGAFQGVGTGCEPSPCPAPGACCLNGGCQILMSFACTSAGGIPGAEGTVCEPRVCCAGDADCDGLADDWEVQGIPIANGTERYQLPGADPKHKDLYVEIDAMTGRAPFESALPAVVASFANSPVPNLDGSDGIALHIVGNDCVTCIDDGDLDDVAWPNDYWGEFDAVKMDYFGTAAERQSSDWDDVRVAKASGYRYGVFANWYGTTEGGLPNTSSGLAERSGNDFFVTLGDFWPGIGADEQAATLMHELGHTLGLCHGGECGSNQEGVNCKPNYFSVMNYTWQLPTQNLNGTADHALYRASWRLDYSRGSLLNLNRSKDLFESTGIGASEALGPGGPPGGTNVDPKIVRMDTRLDWNRDGDTDDGAVAADANYLKGIGGSARRRSEPRGLRRLAAPPVSSGKRSLGG
ncbi:MAG: hypothetical protein R3E12_14270, partial [Candidatus Eisenbacteria bacterium]